MAATSSWSDISIAGSLTDRPVVVSKDSKYVFCCCGPVIKQFGCTTGEEIIELKGHSDTVVGVFLNPNNSLQLYSCSINGELFLWDFSDGAILRTRNISPKGLLLAAYSPAAPGSFVYVAPDTPKGLEGSCSIMYSELQSGSPRRLFRCSNGCIDIALTPDAARVVVLERFAVSVFEMSSKIHSTFKSVTELTAMAVHPREPCIAVGEKDGNIRFWYCLSGESKFDIRQAVARKSKKRSVDASRVSNDMHWHAHQVLSLAFSPDGVYLLSGGYEGVLVIWQLGTGARTFLPRLGAPLRTITVPPDFSHYILGCANNSLRLVEATTRNTIQMIQSLKFSQENPPQSLVIEPMNQLLVIESHPGNLQLYNVRANRHVADLEIANNALQGVDDGARPARVTQHAFSSDGSWLATVDYREAPQTTDHESMRRWKQKVARGSDELCLKFWQYDAGTQRYRLNSRIEQPYKSGRIVGLAAHPKRHCMATVSSSGKIKVWTPARQHQDTDAIFWRCDCIGEYRGLSASGLCYSGDGSLLAVAHQHVVSLWQDHFEPENAEDREETGFEAGITSLTLRSSLSTTLATEWVKHLTFVPNTPFLVTATSEHQLFVWNLLSASVSWSCTANVQCLVADSYSTCANDARFLALVSSDSASKGSNDENDGKSPAVTSSKYVVLWNPSSPKPLGVRPLGQHHQVVSASFWLDARTKDSTASNSSSRISSIVLLNSNRELRIISLATQSTAEVIAKAQARKVGKEQQQAALDALFGTVVSGEKADAPSTVGLLQQAIPHQTPQTSIALFDAASHLIPSASKLYASFMDALLLKANQDAGTATQAPHHGAAVSSSTNATGTPTPNATPNADALVPSSASMALLQQEEQRILTQFYERYDAKASKESEFFAKLHAPAPEEQQMANAVVVIEATELTNGAADMNATNAKTPKRSKKKSSEKSK